MKSVSAFSCHQRTQPAGASHGLGFWHRSLRSGRGGFFSQGRSPLQPKRPHSPLCHRDCRSEGGTGEEKSVKLCDYV